MSNNEVPKVDLPVLYLCLLILFAGLGWMVSVWLLGKIYSTNMTVYYLTSLSWEILKIIFIGTSIGIIVNQFIVKPLISGPFGHIVRKCGIAEIYPARSHESTISHFEKIVKDDRHKNIYLGGISLRDFLHDQGQMWRIWEIITDRLEHEEKNNYEDEKRLQIRCLLLDPRSPEGVFRYHVERGSIGQGLREDVPTSLKNLKATVRRIYGQDSSKYLETRLYGHCPFAFIFSTEDEILMEQYYYKNHARSGNIPLISYRGGTAQYKRFKNSYDKIWESTSTKDLLPNHVGVADAINKVKIENIYRSKQKGALSSREIESIENSATSGVSLLAVTGKHFVTDCDYRNLLKKISKTDRSENSSFNVRLAIVNPVSQVAIIRAVSDSVAFADIGNALQTWDWDEHRKSKLYVNVNDTRREIKNWIDHDQDRFIELKLYTSSIACSLVITDESIFVEQYFLGRSQKFLDGSVLGGEYPVLELSRSSPTTIEEEILVSHFKVIWKYFSIPYDKYSTAGEEDDFNKNLKDLLRGRDIIESCV
jgi:hypothetical protein